MTGGRHTHVYRHDINDWWCNDCATVTDHCTQETEENGAPS